MIGLQRQVGLRRERPRFWEKLPDGTDSIFWGFLEYDRDWRQRDLLTTLEGSREKRLTALELLQSKPCETAIEFVGGLPGGGKSMYSTKLLIDELTYGHRPIVTNLALNIARLQEYLDCLGVHVNVAERVYLLRSSEEIKNFYLRRTHDLLLEMPSFSVEGKQVTWTSSVDWTRTQDDHEAAGGVMYIIDECHNWFHPEAFQLPKFTPEHPMFQWASQHRKLKDICYFVTQSVENVHVAIRRLGQQFHYIRNYRKETYRGFRRGDGFMRTTYSKQPKSESAVPTDEKKFVLDVRGIASCYYTAGGVGIATRGTGDGGHVKKGLSIKWLWIGLAVMVLGAATVLFIIPHMLVSSVVHGNVGKKDAPIVNDQKPGSVISSGTKLVPDAKKADEISPAKKSADEISTPKKPAAADVPDPAPTVWVVGMTGSLARGRYSVYLSDGRTFTEEDGLVSSMGRGSAVIAGKRYFRAPAPGAGAKGAPVRQDAPQRLGDGAPVVVSANVPVQVGQGAVNPSVAVGAFTPPSSTHPAKSNHSSWTVDEDGVSRLVQRVELGK